MRANCETCGEVVVRVSVERQWRWLHLGRVDGLGIPLPAAEQADHPAVVATVEE